jgi:hypothetical protein
MQNNDHNYCKIWCFTIWEKLVFAYTDGTEINSLYKLTYDFQAAYTFLKMLTVANLFKDIWYALITTHKLASLQDSSVHSTISHSSSLYIFQ